MIEFKDVTQGLRRSAADRQPVVQRSGRRDRRHHRPQRRRQVDAVPHDHRQGEARHGRDRDRPRRCSSPSSTRRANRCPTTRPCGRRSRGGQDILTVGTFEMPSRAYLGRFNFKGADQQKIVGDAFRRRARPAASRRDAAARRQRAAAGRAVERPRRRNAARARGCAARVRRQRARDLARSLVPRPHRHAHPRRRGRFAVVVLRGQLPGIRSRQEASAWARKARGRSGSATSR